MGMNHGQTTDIVGENDLYYRISGHGEINTISVSKECLQIAEDIYNYSTNPVIVNNYENS